MGIFGKLDASNIPDNPYFVGEGEYTAIITKSFVHNNQKQNKHQLVIEYKILEAEDEENNKYKNKVVRDWFDMFPEMTQEDYDALTPEEQGDIDAANSAIKRRLCGFKSGSKEYPGLGIDVEDLDENWDPKSLVDTEVELAIVLGGDNKEFSNIKWVNLLGAK